MIWRWAELSVDALAELMSWTLLAAAAGLTPKKNPAEASRTPTTALRAVVKKMRPARFWDLASIRQCSHLGIGIIDRFTQIGLRLASAVDSERLNDPVAHIGIGLLRI